MIATTFSVLIISTIGAGLALLLVFAERYILDYGECEITVNTDKKVRLQGGTTLLDALTREKIFIPSACGGRGSCGYCKVKVLEGAGPLLPTEEPYLEKEEREAGVRLSCQVKVRNDIRIEIPEELLSVRQYDTVCIDIRELTYDTRQFRFQLKDPDLMPFIPGQYVQILAPEYEDSPEEVFRAYSLSSDRTDEGFIELIIRQVPNGICTSYLFDHLQEGDPVQINGPYGQFRMTDTDAPMVFIAGGSGMAPIKCILHQMVNIGSTREATYFFGVNTLRDLYMAEEMRAFEEKLPNFRFLPVVAQPEEGSNWQGETGLVTESLGRNIKDTSSYEAYLCGSPGMIDATVKVLTAGGMSLENIFYDKFS
jgi:Na+-transporting NADH:ubiquinone oxidoreductase subunit F